MLGLWWFISYGSGISKHNCYKGAHKYVHLMCIPVIIVCLGSAVLSSNIADDEAKLNNLPDDCKYGAKQVFIYICA
ncbi:hypothetical protein K1719_017303 [Acacia pycnantha]|nr:hypothetical protein K1719_017303 [Acacia pycnantha]